MNEDYLLFHINEELCALEKYRVVKVLPARGNIISYGLPVITGNPLWLRGTSAHVDPASSIVIDLRVLFEQESTNTQVTPPADEHAQIVVISIQAGSNLQYFGLVVDQVVIDKPSGNNLAGNDLVTTTNPGWFEPVKVIDLLAVLAKITTLLAEREFAPRRS